MPEAGRRRDTGAVLIVGGGVAGMHASLILAEAGVRVFLVDSSPACGGLVTLLDRTFLHRTPAFAIWQYPGRLTVL